MVPFWRTEGTGKDGLQDAAISARGYSKHAEQPVAPAVAARDEGGSFIYMEDIMQATRNEGKSPQPPALDVRRGPLIVGTLSLPGPSGQAVDRAYPCDVVEIRLDLVGGADTDTWLEAGRRIERAGYPVVLTLRLKAEGGAWTGDDVDREPILARALAHLAAVDVELRSPLAARLCMQGARLGKPVIVSYHNFEMTPCLAELREVVRRARLGPAAVPKVATMLRDEADFQTLRELLEQERAQPLCVLGMGPLGGRTRTAFPALGSCLTYGYLDAPVAPGQLSALELTRTLRATGSIHMPSEVLPPLSS